MRLSFLIYKQINVVDFPESWQWLNYVIQVMEKLVDIVHFLILGIDNAYVGMHLITIFYSLYLCLPSACFPCIYFKLYILHIWKMMLLVLSYFDSTSIEVYIDSQKLIFSLTLISEMHIAISFFLNLIFSSLNKRKWLFAIFSGRQIENYFTKDARGKRNTTPWQCHLFLCFHLKTQI